MSNYFPQQTFDESFNCSNGCESANQCEFNNGTNNNNDNYVAYQYNQQIQPPQQPFFAAASNECVSNNYEDGVVPSNSIENGYQQQMHLTQPNNYVASNDQFNNYYYGVDSNATGSSVTSYNTNVNMSNESYTYNEQSYVPCRGPRPWNFAECFGFYGEAPCQYANVAVDMEDFM